jgi:tetratricopeptide (TPR) repeat protein
MSFACLLFVAAFLVPFSADAQSANPQETLNQYISDLQKNPNDYALREKIIKLVQEMKQKPGISAEAEKYEGRAGYAIKNAKNEADFLDAAKEYDKALLLAPWVSSYYFNQAIAYEKAGKPKEAKRSFEFYLFAEPNAKDARDVRKRIAGLEYAAEKAAKEPAPQSVAAREQNKFEDWLKKLDGARFFVNGVEQYNCLEIRGKAAVMGNVVTGVFRENGFYPRYTIKGREFDMPANPAADISHSVARFDEDGTTITVRFDNGGEQVFRRKQ